MKLDDLIDDIYAMEKIVKEYEKRYGITSQHFYQLYRAGELDDGDFERTQDFCEWAGAYEIKLEREREFEELSERLLDSLRRKPKPIRLEPIYRSATT